MKNIVAISAICLTGISITACGKTETVYIEKSTLPPTTSPTTTQTPQTTQPAWTQEDEYLWDIKSQYGSSIVNDATLIETGHAVCDTLRAGVPIEQVIFALIQSSQGNYQIQEYLTVVVASAIINFCPEQQYQLN